MSQNHGKFVWYELTTPDVEASTRFYADIAGLGTGTMPGMGDYTFWNKPDGEMMGGMSPGAPPAWMCSVAVSDLEGSVAKARELGATIVVPPTEIPDMGRFAVIIDPQGATLGLYVGNDDRPMAGVDRTLGGVSWHELLTSDLDGAKRFYAALFGWKETSAMDMGPEYGTYSMFGHAEVSYGGMMNRPPSMPASAWVPYLTVPSTRAAAERASTLGGVILNPPMEVPGGGVAAMGLDPQGATFAVFSEA